MSVSPESLAPQIDVESEASATDDEATVDQHEALREPSGVEVSFDHDTLLDIRERAPDGAKPVIEALLKMPERLNFEPGVTIIVGENGAGKSTIAKSIYFARLLAQSEPHADGRAKGLEDLRTGSQDYLLLQSSGPLVAELVSAIKVNPPSQESEPYLEYVDYGRLHSQSGENKESEETHRIAGSVGVDGEGRAITISGGRKAEVPRFKAQEKENYGILGPPPSDYKEDTDSYNPYSSARQYIDMALKERMKMRSERLNGTNTLVVHDEPEVGMGPRRQMEELRQTILGHSGEGSVALVATNSVALYMDDTLPRIDLDAPERGIFTPADYA